jgi:hypothetical protein
VHSDLSKPLNGFFYRVRPLAFSIAAIALSALFPGLGFLVYLGARGRLSNLRKGTLIILVVLEAAYLITALGTMYGPVISTIGTATPA